MKILLATGVMLAVALSTLTARAVGVTGDPAAGKARFVVCASCHAVSASAPRKAGPHLAGVVGAKAGVQDPSFTYSSALRTAAPRWTEANLDAFLTSPARMLPGNRMAFAGLPRKQDRDNIIAYLKTLK